MASWLQCHLTNLSPPETDVCYKGQPAVGSRSCFKDSSPETPSCKAPGRWSAAWIWPHIRGSGSERAQAGASLILNLKSLPLRLHTPGVCLLLAVVTEGGLSCWGGGVWSALECREEPSPSHRTEARTSAPATLPLPLGLPEHFLVLDSSTSRRTEDARGGHPATNSQTEVGRGPILPLGHHLSRWPLHQTGGATPLGGVSGGRLHD